MRSHWEAKTGLNLEYAMYNRCTAGTGDWEVERQGNQPFVILDEWCAIKADIVNIREYSHYMELAIRRGRLAMLSNVVSIVQYFWNLPGLPLCRHISQYTWIFGQSESREETNPDTRSRIYELLKKKNISCHMGDIPDIIRHFKDARARYETGFEVHVERTAIHRRSFQGE